MPHRDWCRAILRARTWAHKHRVASPSPCEFIKCSVRVVPQVAWMLRSPEDSHRWWVANRKSLCCWNGGNKPNLVKGRWSYSRVKAGLENQCDQARLVKGNWRLRCLHETLFVVQRVRSPS